MLALLIVSITLTLCSRPAYAQQEKGDIEILVFSGGFFIGIDDDSDFSSGNIGAKAGYFLTRKHEVGGGLNFSVFRFGGGDDDDSETNFGLGLIGFYRYNIASKNAKGFPFVGTEVTVSDVTEEFGRLVSLRPNVGYKYFVRRNVALDFSVGYSVDLNKFDNGFFSLQRRQSINGQIGLAFVF